jgi:hypothetical protein
MPALRTGFDALRNQGTYVNVAGWEVAVSLEEWKRRVEMLTTRSLLYRWISSI